MSTKCRDDVPPELKRRIAEALGEPMPPSDGVRDPRADGGVRAHLLSVRPDPEEPRVKSARIRLVSLLALSLFGADPRGRARRRVDARASPNESSSGSTGSASSWPRASPSGCSRPLFGYYVRVLRPKWRGRQPS